MLQLHYVRCFVAVAQELHFGRAAARLDMTQAPLSRNIQQLEWLLGVVLLERQQQALKLTAAGRAFLPEALHLLEAAGTAELSMRSLSACRASVVQLGHVPGASFDLVPRVLREVNERWPALAVVLLEMSNGEALAAVHSGRLGLAVVRAPAETQGLADHCVAREPLVAAIPERHPLARLERLALRDFQGQPFVMYRPGAPGFYYEILSYAFLAAGVVPRQVQQVQQTHTILALVGRGIGLALLPESTARSHYQGVAYRPVELPAHAVSELHLVWQPHEGFQHTPEARLAQLILSLAAPVSRAPSASP
jgi:DNA-binding transcriptional LysR family regulator